jgi:ankyrin repeat protein
MNALLQDVRRGDLASVQARIGADRSLLNACGHPLPYTALEWAVRHRRLHIARYLVDEGAQVNEEDGSGSPALRQACRLANQAMVELLLEAGADAVTPNGHGDTALIWAAREGYVGTTLALLAHGCGDIDARDKYGRTALWRACGCNEDEGVTLVLLEAGADMGIADTQGMTALDRARQGGCKGCVAVLEVRELFCQT